MKDRLGLSDASVVELSDTEVLEGTADAVARERGATATVVALLQELDRRRLYLSEGFPSLFSYCTKALHLSEQAAYNRIEAARACARFPALLRALEAGTVTLATVRLIAPHLTKETFTSRLAAASHRCKRDVEQLVAEWAPKADVATSLRHAPTLRRVAVSPAVPRGVFAVRAEEPGASTATQDAPSLLEPSAANAAAVMTVARRPDTVKPLSPERFLLRTTISGEAHRRLRRAQDLMRHTNPSGDVALVIERALAVLVERLEYQRTAKSGKPRTVTTSSSPAGAGRGRGTGRSVPAPIKRAVWARDAGRCAFVGSTGRCPETGFLEIHHIVPFAARGPTVIENLELRCRAHNMHHATLYFGERHMETFQKRPTEGA